MRSLPYKNVITSHSVYTASNVLTISLIKAKLKNENRELHLSKKGMIKAEAIPIIENLAFPGRNKLQLHDKIETFIHEQNVYDILAKKNISFEYKSYQDNIKFEISEEGKLWSIMKNGKSISVSIEPFHRFIIEQFLEVIKN
jgi:hypothetical protein